MAKFQLCMFKQNKSDSWKRGIAKVKGFCISDVDFIFDDDGKKIPSVWDYKLLTATNHNDYIDTEGAVY